MFRVVIRNFSNHRDVLTPVALILAMLTAWEFGARWANVPEWLLPTPGVIVEAAWRTRFLLVEHAAWTLLEAVLGLVLALLLGVALGAAVDLSPFLRRALYPLLVTSQTIPLFAIAPLLIIWFGFGLEPKVAVVVLVCFFPIVVSTADGLASADPDLLALLRAMGATRWQVWLKVRFPAALPSLFSGLRIAATYSVIGAIFGEWVGAQYGLGVYLQRSFSAARTAQVFAAIAVTSILSIALFGVVWLAERLSLPWYHTSERHARWGEPGIY